MSNESLRESVSALADGELAPARAARVLDEVMADAELREQWRRHFAISAVLSGHGRPVTETADLAQRVRDALEREPVLAERRLAPRRRALTVTALAASVAVFAVVVGLGLAGRQAPPDATPVAASGAAVPALAGRPAETGQPPAKRTRMMWADARPAVEARLNGYLLTHNEYLADGVRGMLPYARVVGYDSRR